jgi:hypothetical protein
MENRKYQLLTIITIFLCLTPIIGLIISIYVFLNKRKLNGLLVRPFVIIGLVINSVLIGALIYLSLNDSYFKDSEEQLAKIKLNNIVKSIEYYNLINSEYPDSLSELKLEDPLELNIDFIQVSKSRQEVTFFYSKIGSEKYFLFSRGIDGIEFTHDDIYPTLSSSERTGLVFPEKGEIIK